MREPNTAIGELAVWIDSRRWFFRPSLLAMSRLGTPAEIVEKFAACMGGFSRESFLISVNVLWACCTEGEPSELTGYVRTYGKWVPGKLPPEDVHSLACALLTHGITSNVKSEDPPKKGVKQYSQEFKATESASLAVAHLGVSEAEAWNMTMTGLVMAMRAKYHDSSKPTVKEQVAEADNTMEWLERVNAMRGNG